MMRKAMSMTELATIVLLMISCGGGGSGAEDAATEDTVITDQPQDTSGDEAVHDQGADEPSGDQADTPSDDAGPDGADVPQDAATACEAAGGYCTSVAVSPDACVVCETAGFMPAPPDDSPMGCTVEGIGTSPWCCRPVPPTAENPCETSGGRCYPPSPTEEPPCPIGWDGAAASCNSDMVCCRPGGNC